MPRTRKYAQRMLARFVTAAGKERIVSLSTVYALEVDGEVQTVIDIYSNLGVRSEKDAKAAEKLFSIIFTRSVGESQGRRLQGKL